MTEENTVPENEEVAVKSLRLDDSVIHIVRELLQLSLYTQTNIIDHLRAVRVQEENGTVRVTDEYVAAYNEMVTAMTEKAQKMAAEAQSKLATD